MRQLLIQVPYGKGDEVLEHARSSEAIATAQMEADSEEGRLDVVIVHLSNRRVSSFLEAIEPLPELRVSFFPQGVLALRPPTEKVPSQVKDVEERSPVEVYLSGVQSVGSWRGFLGYAAATGVVAWIGLFTNTIYLLTAAMLIAPFAGPAMNTAIAAVSGDGDLLRTSLLRYGSSIVVTIFVSWLISLGIQLQSATTQMVDQSQVSAVAVMLPLVAGAAGALHLVQSDRSSLVSGAAVGMLVAASLAPPTAMVGMAIALARWDLVTSGVFVLLLQLAGITFASMIVFKMFGVTGKGARYEPESRRLFPGGLVASALVLAGLLVWQFASPGTFQRSSLSKQVDEEIRRIVHRQPGIAIVEAESRFTRPSAEEGDVLLSRVYVRRTAGAERSDAALSQVTRDSILTGVTEKWPYVRPLVDVSVLRGAANFSGEQ